MASLELDDEKLPLVLAGVLQTWPLYRRLEYTGAHGIIAVPKYLQLFCQRYKLESFWETSISEEGRYSSAENNKTGLTQKEYKCRNCGFGPVRYYFYWMKNGNLSLFYKVGQSPELEERVSQELQAALSEDDLKVYKNALRMRNFNLGIAAVAYTQRPVGG